MAAEFIEIKYNEAKLRHIEELLRDCPRELPKVMSRGINRTAKSARAEIIKQLAKKIGMKQKAIRAAITLHKATRRFWEASIYITGRRIPLINFRARKTKKGVTTTAPSVFEAGKKIASGTGRHLVKSAFIQTMPASGHRGVFRRFDLRKERLPIIELFGPGIGTMFRKARKLAKTIQKSTGKKLEANIDAQIKFILNKRRAG